LAECHGRVAKSRDCACRESTDDLLLLLARGTICQHRPKRPLKAPAWPGPPGWLHGDLQAGNVLAVHGRLSAVIDFGCLGVGDSACDVMAAWLFLSAETRDAFRAALSVDDAT
jgi:hypothetical protein